MIARVRALVLLLLLTVLVAGCGGSKKGIEGPLAVSLPVSGMTLLVSGPFRADSGDVMEGKPQFVNDRCLGFMSSGQVYVAVWPNGTRITSEDDDSIIVNGHTLTPDTTFSMRASLVHQPFPKQFPELPLPCVGDGLQPVAWVHQVTRVEE